MTVEQVDKLLHRIKLHKPNFMYNFTSQQERELKEIWCDVLWDYDAEKVNNRLDEFLADINNNSKNVTVYNLVDGLSKKTYSDRDIYVKCRVCNDRVNIKQYDQHLVKCNSIDYLRSQLKKFSMKVYSRQELLKLSDEDFDKLYWDLLKVFKVKTENQAEQHLINNALRTHYGQAPNLDLEDVIKGMASRK